MAAAAARRKQEAAAQPTTGFGLREGGRETAAARAAAHPHAHARFEKGPPTHARALQKSDARAFEARVSENQTRRASFSSRAGPTDVTAPFRPLSRPVPMNSTFRFHSRALSPITFAFTQTESPASSSVRAVGGAHAFEAPRPARTRARASKRVCLIFEARARVGGPFSKRARVWVRCGVWEAEGAWPPGGPRHPTPFQTPHHPFSNSAPEFEKGSNSGAEFDATEAPGRLAAAGAGQPAPAGDREGRGGKRRGRRGSSARRRRRRTARWLPSSLARATLAR